MIVRYTESERLLRESVNKNVSHRSHALKNGALLLKTSQDREQQAAANHQGKGEMRFIKGHAFLLKSLQHHAKITNAMKQGKSKCGMTEYDSLRHPVQQKSRAVRKDRRSDAQATVIYCVENSVLFFFHSPHFFFAGELR